MEDHDISRIGQPLKGLMVQYDAKSINCGPATIWSKQNGFAQKTHSLFATQNERRFVIFCTQSAKTCEKKGKNRPTSVILGHHVIQFSESLSHDKDSAKETLKPPVPV